MCANTLRGAGGADATTKDLPRSRLPRASGRSRHGVKRSSEGCVAGNPKPALPLLSSTWLLRVAFERHRWNLPELWRLEGSGARGAHLVMCTPDAGKLYDPLATHTAVYRRVELIAFAECSLHVAHRVQRYLQCLQRCSCSPAGPATVYWMDWGCTPTPTKLGGCSRAVYTVTRTHACSG